jgi:CDP-glycerol glycerophosphotransferase
MKISVIIPAYNGEKWIAQCIENVLCQSYKNLEIIVIDDGSKDRTAEIAADYPSVKLIRQHNQGLSVSRNNGARAATGDYIHFLDVDDLLNREYYASMVDALGDDNRDGAKIDMVFGGFFNEAQPDFSISYHDRLMLVSLEDKVGVTNASQMGFAWRYLIRREFFERQGLQFEPGRLLEDLPFTLEAVARARCIVTAPGAMYHYMNRGGSILSSRNREHARKLKADYKHSRELRAEFMRRHDLSVNPYKKVEYKIFGIPMLYKFKLRNGRTRWYFAGLYVLQKKSVRP